LLRKNFKNISYQSIAQLVPRAIMFLFVMYLARTLGGTEYGKYEFATSLGYLVGIFFELGGNMILTKHTARNFYSSIYYAVKIRIASILITLAVFFTLLFVFGIYSEIRLYVFYSCIGLAFSSMMNLYFAFFRGAGKMSYEAIVLIIQKAIFIVLALFLLYVGNTGSNVLLGFMLSMIAGFLIIFVIFKRQESYYVSIGSNAEDIKFKDYMIDVLSLALVEVFGTVYFRLTQIFLAHFHGFEEVSTYSIAYRIVEVFTGFPAILLLALFPAFAKLATVNIRDFRHQFNKVVSLLFAAGLLSAVFCWFGGEYIFKLLGKDYNRSYVILRYLSFPLLFLFPNYIVTQGLIALNKNMVFAGILIAALLLNAALSFVLVPTMGAAGSAISVGICEMVIFVSGYYFIRKFTVNAD
jgi:O-antigen/teichoic acid export membrane protein